MGETEKAVVCHGCDLNVACKLWIRELQSSSVVHGTERLAEIVCPVQCLKNKGTYKTYNQLFFRNY